MERGCTHFTHWFQPLTGLDRREARLLLRAHRRRQRDRRVLRQGAHPGRAGRLLVPDRRHPGDLRGARLHGVGPVLAGLHPREPQRGAALHPDGVRVLDGRGARPQDPAAALDGRAVELGPARAQAARRRDGRRRVFTTIGPEQEYFLIDETYYFERPDLDHHRPHAVRRQAARRATSSTTTTSARSPSASWPTCSRPSRSWPSSACRSRRATTRSRRTSTRSRRCSRTPTWAPTTSSSACRCMQNVARRYDLVCLLHEKPFAGVNGSGKHNNWSMGTDTGVNLLEPGDTPHENLQFLFFCTAVMAAVDRHQALLRASIAGAGQDHRLGANEAPPAIISIFLGAELQKIYDAIECGSGDAATPSSYLKLGASVLPRAADARRRPQPHLAVRLHRQQVRVPGARLVAVARAAQHGAQHDRRRRPSTSWPTRWRPSWRTAPSSPRRCSPSSRTPTASTSGSSSTATTTPRSGTTRPRSGGWRTCARRPTRCPT